MEHLARCSRVACHLLAVSLTVVASGIAQVAVTTHHNDNSRTGQNVNETYLTPANVNLNQFGRLFSHPLDGMVVGQSLYLPNVAVPGAGTHNVVYVATQHDGVYAFDADNISGRNASPLWYVSLINPKLGITSVPIADQSCGGVTGFTEIGIIGTPVIDQAAGTLFLVAKTLENGAYVHRLHALNVATGAEQPSSPVVITGSVTVGRRTVTFDDRHHMQRPALLLTNGTVYVAFGTLGCRQFQPSVGWLMAYNATTLEQVGVFNAAPDKNDLPGFWQSGFGPASEDDGSVFLAAGDGVFTANTGGNDFGDSLLKMQLGTDGLGVVDYFTPKNESFLLQHDEDLGSSGPVLLPTQPGDFPDLAIIAGKGGEIYLLNRDNLGQFNPLMDEVVQELSFVGEVHGGATYWNGFVYFGSFGFPIFAYSLSNGGLSPGPVAQTVGNVFGNSLLSVSSNGTDAGILWAMDNVAANAPSLSAFDATTLKLLYSSKQKSPLGQFTHFVIPTVANGKVYLAGTKQLSVMGLLSVLSASGGNNQSGTVGQPLPSPLQVTASDPYSGNPIAGALVTFTDGGKGGSFNPTSATTNSQGIVTTQYTLPPKPGNITITASSTNYVSAFFTETANPGAPTTLSAVSGGFQSATAGTTLPAPLIVRLKDAFGNGVPGLPISFTDNGAGGIFSSNPVVTDSTGAASVGYTLPTKSGQFALVASYNALTVTFQEKGVAGVPASITIVFGNNQSAPRGTQLPRPLAIIVQDQFSNPVPGVTITFSDGGAGGTFSTTTPITNNGGQASVSYTLPNAPGVLNISATINGLSASFTETSQ